MSGTFMLNNRNYTASGNLRLGGGASIIQKTMAEYTALPSSEKMNGSIYKITDKALIYCLDEEYHAVKEITSADYALLTSAEKNNGTLYVITDEETTAADIPYSQGVSVADKIDSINTCETIYTQATYQNDIGTARSIGDYDFRNYRVLRITLYNTSISSSTRVTVVIVNANGSIGASYYPCVLNGTNGNIRFESTNATITVLASSFGNSICIGEIKGVR